MIAEGPPNGTFINHNYNIAHSLRVHWLFCDVGVMTLKGLSEGNFGGYFMQVVPLVFDRSIARP